VPADNVDDDDNESGMSDRLMNLAGEAIWRPGIDRSPPRNHLRILDFTIAMDSAAEPGGVRL